MNPIPLLSEVAQRIAALMAASPESADEAEFDWLAQLLFAAQFEHNPNYRAFSVAQRKIPERISNWRDLPFAPTSAFKDCELTSLTVSDRTRVFYSSATTGQARSRHFHNRESLGFYERSLKPPFRRFLIDPIGCGAAAGFPRLVSLTPVDSQVPNSSLVYMLAAVGSEFFSGSSVFVGQLSGESTWQIDYEQALVELRRSVADRGPIVLVGTAFNFVELLDFLAREDQRFQLPPGSRVMETGGYKGRTREVPRGELVHWIADRLGIATECVVSEYGMSELSSQAYETRDSEGITQGYQFPHWVRFRIVSPETGQDQTEGTPGLLQILDLANVWSVAAVQTGDLAVQEGERFRLLGRAPKTEVRGCSLMTA